MKNYQGFSFHVVNFMHRNFEKKKFHNLNVNWGNL